MVKIAAIVIVIVSTWTNVAGAVLCPNGQFVNGTSPQACSGTCAYSQIGSGNSQYGNSSRYTAGNVIARDIFSVASKIVHITCDNTTGGTCGVPPQFIPYYFDSGVEHDGAAITCNTTIDPPGSTNDIAVNLAVPAGNEMGIKIGTLGSGCNAPTYDVDIMVGIGSGC